MTNHHCVADEQVCGSTSVIFGYQYDRNGLLHLGEQFDCAKVHKADFDLDYALLELTRNPLNTWGALKLNSGDPIRQAPMFVVQHPSGEPKMISKIECQTSEIPVNGRAVESDFTHSCDVAGGSSGSPMLNEAGEVIGLHHYGFAEGGVWRENRAVRMLHIAASIHRR